MESILDKDEKFHVVRNEQQIFLKSGLIQVALISGEHRSGHRLMTDDGIVYLYRRDGDEQFKFHRKDINYVTMTSHWKGMSEGVKKGAFYIGGGYALAVSLVDPTMALFVGLYGGLTGAFIGGVGGAVFGHRDIYVFDLVSPPSSEVEIKPSSLIELDRRGINKKESTDFLDIEE
ncbi:MAG: hypothetical protein OEZ43_07725 [Gammaproteobacteria bacterium]|nr:hypothetical protein [Gammaproteobacteria bacterium]